MTNYSIKQAAQATGVSIATLRYYEQEGLLRNIQRLPNGHRRYSEQDILWIEFLICLRDSGMAIQELKQYVTLCYRPGTGHERCALLEAHRIALQAKIASLQHRLERIDDKINWYHERLPQLPEQQLNSEKEKQLTPNLKFRRDK